MPWIQWPLSLRRSLTIFWNCAIAAAGPNICWMSASRALECTCILIFAEQSPGNTLPPEELSKRWHTKSNLGVINNKPNSKRTWCWVKGTFLLTLFVNWFYLLVIVINKRHLRKVFQNYHSSNSCSSLLFSYLCHLITDVPSWNQNSRPESLVTGTHL